MSDQHEDQGTSQTGESSKEKKGNDGEVKDDQKPSSSKDQSNPVAGDKSNNNQEPKETEDVEMGEEELVDERKESTLDCYYIILALVLGAILLGVLVYFAVSSLKEKPLAISNVTEAINSTDFNSTYFVTEPTVLPHWARNSTDPSG